MRRRVVAGRPGWVVAAAGLAAAVPSLLWAADGSGLIHDDWSFAAQAELSGVWQTILHSSSRPVASLLFGLSFGAFGTDALSHALLLAALNGLAAALLAVVLYRLLGPAPAVWTTLTWVALPNRGSTRLWFATTPAVVALCLLLAGVLLLVAGRPVPAGVVMAVGVLAYEGIVAVAVASIAAWAGSCGRGAARRAAVSATPVVLAAALIILRSPKRAGAAPFSHASNVLAAQFGPGVFGDRSQLALLVLLGAAVPVSKHLLPTFRQSINERDRLVVVGLVLVVLGSAPFFVAGFPFATSGIFDRGNLVGGLGTALMLGALLCWLAPLMAGLGLVFGAGALGYVSLLNLVDLRDYRQAVHDGEALQRRLASDVVVVDRPLVVGPPLPNRNGVAQFIAYEDLGAALQLARHDPRIRARIAVSRHDFLTAAEPLRYDWVRRELTRRGG